MKEFGLAFLISLFVPAAFWIGGFNFDTRGHVAVGVFVFWVWLFSSAYGFLRIGKS